MKYESSILKINPANNYDDLLKQFSALKTLAYCIEEQLRYYQKHHRLEYLARNQLDSEREANALLTAEIEKLQAQLKLRK